MNTTTLHWPKSIEIVTQWQQLHDTPWQKCTFYRVAEKINTLCCMANYAICSTKTPKHLRYNSIITFVNWQFFKQKCLNYINIFWHLEKNLHILVFYPKRLWWLVLWMTHHFCRNILVMTTSSPLVLGLLSEINEYFKNVM